MPKNGAKKWLKQLLKPHEDLMEKYLETGELSEEEIKKGLRKRTMQYEIVPVFCGSAFKNKGVQALLDAVIEYLPSPIDVPAVQGIWMKMATETHAQDMR